MSHGDHQVFGSFASSDLELNTSVEYSQENTKRRNQKQRGMVICIISCKWTWFKGGRQQIWIGSLCGGMPALWGGRERLPGSTGGLSVEDTAGEPVWLPWAQFVLVGTMAGRSARSRQRPGHLACSGHVTREGSSLSLCCSSQSRALSSSCSRERRWGVRALPPGVAALPGRLLL